MTFLITKPQLHSRKKGMAALTEFDVPGEKIAGVHAESLLQAQDVVGIEQQMHIGTADEKTRHFRVAAKSKTVFCVYLLPLALAGFVHGSC